MDISTSYKVLISGGMFVLLFFVLYLFDRTYKRVGERWAKATVDFERLNREDIACMMLIREICRDEGWAVTLTHANPDFDAGPDMVITVCGDWPGEPADVPWREIRFEGDSYLDCLRQALKYKGGFDEFVVKKLQELRSLV